MQHSPRWIIWEALNIFNSSIDTKKFVERISTKKYSSEITDEEFQARQKEYNQKKNAGSLDFNDYGVLIEEKQTVLYFKNEDKSYKMGLPIIKQDDFIDTEVTSIVEKELFWEVYGRLSRSRIIVRLLILILLITCGVLFLIVFLQNIIAGFSYIF